MDNYSVEQVRQIFDRIRALVETARESLEYAVSRTDDPGARAHVIAAKALVEAARGESFSLSPLADVDDEINTLRQRLERLEDERERASPLRPVDA